MSKPVLGLLLGAILGLLDGASAYLYPYPDVKAQIVGIMIGSMFKGLLTGLATGFFATRLKSLPLGMLVGLAIGCLLSWGVVAMQPPGQQYYVEIMIPGSLLGAVVGYATWRFGRSPRPAATRTA
jgi:NO-binding membrane sensor protein with MHYT domain